MTSDHSDDGNNNNVVAVVTGANKGLGYALVKLLAQRHPKWTIYLTARDEQRGKTAVDALMSSLAPNNNNNNAGIGIFFHQLDIANLQSVRNFKATLQQKHPQGINLLINNAGVMPNVRASSSDQLNHRQEGENNRYHFAKEAVLSTVMTNFFGTLNVLSELLPLMSPQNGTVINISSRLARSFYGKCTQQIQKRLDGAKTVEELCQLANDFLQAATSDDQQDLQASGWLNVNPATALHLSYQIGDLIPMGFTHAAISALTQILQNDTNSIAINTVCPGSIKTDMNPTGVYSPEQGADSILYLASRLDEKPWDDRVANLRGHFIADRQSYADWRLVPSDIAEDT